jgi:hypothetical protein
MSPVGLSITSVGAEGVEGDENAYPKGDAWTLMSLKGQILDMEQLGENSSIYSLQDGTVIKDTCCLTDHRFWPWHWTPASVTQIRPTNHQPLTRPTNLSLVVTRLNIGRSEDQNGDCSNI